MNRDKQLLNEFIERERLKGLKEFTVYGKLRNIRNFFKYIKHPLKARCEDIEEYLDKLSSKNLSPVTYNKIISHLNEFYEFLEEKGEVLINPVSGTERLKQTQGEHRGVFSEDEVKRLIGKILENRSGRRDRAILELFYSTGMRLSELVNLDIDDVDSANREIYVRKGKFDRERIVPVGEEALKALERYMNDRYMDRFMSERDALFLSQRGNRFRAKDVREMIHRRKRNAGIKTRGATHALRHSCATHMLGRGAPIHLIRRLLGHEYLSTTQRYTHISDEDMKGIHRSSHPGSQEAE